MSRPTVEVARNVEVALVALFDEGEEQVMLANLSGHVDEVMAAIRSGDLARARFLCRAMRNAITREQARAAQEMAELARAAELNGYPYIHPDFLDECSGAEKATL